MTHRPTLPNNLALVDNNIIITIHPSRNRNAKTKKHTHTQDLQYATILSEAVYARSEEAMREAVGALATALGVDRPLTDVSVHNAAGQR